MTGHGRVSQMLSHRASFKGKTAVLVLSGGQDSATCGFWARDQGMKLHAITFNYGQRHAVEIEAALRIAALLEVESHEILNLGDDVLKGTSPLTNKKVELEQYADHHSLPGGLEKTFVPMRNQLFLTIAANRAYVLGTDRLITGVCQEDSGGYPDCTQLFISSFEQAADVGTFTGDDNAPDGLIIHTPLMQLTKAESVIMALRLPGCYSALQWTHTAYDGAFPPVGKDHATLLRAKGFEEADWPDPLVVRAWKLGLMPLPQTKNYRHERVTQAQSMMAGTPSVAHL